jgi:hypothetical protein
MDYGKILGRAWEITWRWKILWILGFLAALGNGSGASSSSSSYSGDSGEWSRTFYDGIPPEVAGIILALLCLGLFIAIAIWVVSIIARGGLIAGVHQVEEEESTSFGEAWRAGASRFWTLFGVSFLAALPMILLAIVGLVVLMVTVLGGVAVSDTPEAIAGVVLPAILCGGVLCCGAVILSIILAQIRIYAERAAVLEGLGWIDAFKRGWEVLKDNLGPTVVFWIIFFVIGLALVAVIGGIVVAMFIPFLAVMFNTDPGAWMAVPICCGGLLAIIVGAVVGAIVETFTSATWTLAYREMIGLGAPEASEPEVLEPAAE